ncbi:MAG: sigma-70 family RNA polymerase sigma factor [Bryobacteraceae bacterium]
MDLDREVHPGSAKPGAPAPGSALASEAALVAGVRAKDRKATAEFVDRFAGPVEHYLKARLWPRADLVDDLAQEVFLAAWERFDSYRGDAPLRAWLLGIARHKVEDHYRAVVRAEPVPMDDIAEPPGDELAIDEALDRTQAAERMREILAMLTPPYGVLLQWRYWEKRSLREMAERTGRTEKAVERLLARARVHFRREWNTRGGDPQ